MRILLHGCGVVGSRTARQLLSLSGLSDLALCGPGTDRLATVATSLGAPARVVGIDAVRFDDFDAVILAGPAPHADLARRALEAGTDVLSTSDALDDVEHLLALDGLAIRMGRRLLVGVGFSPGLSCVLARHAGAEFERVDEVHVAKLGTAGPACARQHHLALQTAGRDWRDGAWVDVRGGSGRELCWFPEPIAGADCYRAALAEPLLLRAVAPTAERVTARMSATRRDRLTARLPMMRRPHAEAGAGAIRVEVRGMSNGMSDVVVFGCMDRPSVATATVVAVATHRVLQGGVGEPGARGLGLAVDPVAFLRDLATRGVKCARFDGSPSHVR